MNDRDILQAIANVISQDNPPTQILRTVAALLDEANIEPQFFQTLRDWPAEARDRIVENSKRIPSQFQPAAPKPTVWSRLPSGADTA